MTGPAVQVAHVDKRFSRGERFDSLRDLLPRAARALFSRSVREELRGHEFWALRDVSFEIAPGEALGVIGPNGAGKSTLLRILTHILQPTRGRVDVRGRVSALIEVAAGFHPDLTGRENIYLQGAVLGMGRAEIDRHLEAIVEFAGVGAFVDTPVKRFSSGMQARLGFAIAAHIEPDVLLIDEVLSVGDMAFQQKCVERMCEFKRQGVAMAFVSHNLQAVSMLCDRALYLQHEVRAYGPVQDVLGAYVGTVAGASTDGGDVSITDVRLSDPLDRPVSVVPSHAPLRLCATYDAVEPIEDVTFGVIVHRSTDGFVMFDGNVPGADAGVTRLSSGAPATVAFDFRVHLSRGQYHLELHVLHNPTRRFLARLRPAASFTVDESRTFSGVVDLELHGHQVVPACR